MPASAWNLAELVRDSAAWRPERAALVAGPRRLTWGQLDRAVDAFAAGVAGAGALGTPVLGTGVLGSGELGGGLPAGARVALALGNVPEFAVAYFGVLRGGLVAVPVNPGYTSRELTHVLADAEAALVVCGADACAAVRAAARATHARVVVLGAEPGPGETAYAALLDAGAGHGRVEPTTGDEDLAVLLYTSGTGGRPKGAMLPHRALLANLDQCARIDPAPMTSDDVVLLALPLFHIYGLSAALGMLARTGATGVLAERFDPAVTLALIRDATITCVPAIPPMFVAWTMLPDLSEAFAGVRLAFSAAAPLPHRVFDAMLAATGRPIYEGYGLTETAAVVTSSLCSAVVKPGSVGQPIPGVDLRLVDDTGDAVDPGDPGEIVVRGESVFRGYWPDGAGGPDPGGWFATGDIAYADGDGDLFLVDRRQELILVSGFNVYPREVEQVLLSHPAVAEAAVLGAPHPYTGETVTAFVVAHPGAPLDPADVIAHCARSLARFKCPTSVRVVSALPRGATGKIVKGRLRAVSPSPGPAG